LEFINKFRENGIRFTAFREPDFDGELTAVAIEPGDLSRKLCSNLSLLLKK